MSKTFKSALNPTELEVGTYTDSQVALAIGYVDGEDLGVVYLAPSDAPALALAILEAAGVEAKPHEAATVPYGTPAHLGMIASHLKAYAEAKSMNDAEAKEQAKLEAEALELCNEYVRSADGKPYDSWEEIVRASKRMAENWLAVARRAREMRAEK